MYEVGELKFLPNDQTRLWVAQNAHLPMPVRGPEGEPGLWSVGTAPETENSLEYPEPPLEATMEDRIIAMSMDPDLTAIIEIELGLDPGDKDMSEEHIDALMALEIIGVRYEVSQWHMLTDDQAEDAERECRNRIYIEREKDLRKLHRRLWAV